MMSMYMEAAGSAVWMRHFLAAAYPVDVGAPIPATSKHARAATIAFCFIGLCLSVFVTTETSY